MLVLATYPSSHAVLRAEKRLKAAGLAVDLIPVPRQIHSNCGFCILTDLEAAGDILGSTCPDALWRALDPEPGSLRRRYEPHPSNP